jgi:nitroreductase
MASTTFILVHPKERVCSDVQRNVSELRTGYAACMELDVFDYLLSSARSVRRKLDFDREVPRAVLESAIDVAVQAPVSMAGENWRFLVVNDAEQKAQIAALYRESLASLLEARGAPMKPTHRDLVDRLHEIPCMVFVCATGDPGSSRGQHLAFYGSILPAAWSLMLAIRARDIGTTWTTLLSAREAEVRAILGIPDDVVPTVMFPVAYTRGATLRPADRQPASALTYWNRWGMSDPE